MHVSDLKDDVLNIIFRQLSAEDLVNRVAPVCRHWYALPTFDPPAPRSPSTRKPNTHCALPSPCWWTPLTGTLRLSGPLWRWATSSGRLAFRTQAGALQRTVYRRRCSPTCVLQVCLA